MGITALVLSVILYFIVAGSLVLKKDYPLAVVFGCYAVSNVAFIWKMTQ